jgi:hypothetical protein
MMGMGLIRTIMYAAAVTIFNIIDINFTYYYICITSVYYCLPQDGKHLLKHVGEFMSLDNL